MIIRAEVLRQICVLNNTSMEFNVFSLSVSIKDYCTFKLINNNVISSDLVRLFRRVGAVGREEAELLVNGFGERKHHKSGKEEGH